MTNTMGMGSSLMKNTLMKENSRMGCSMVKESSGTKMDKFTMDHSRKTAN